jgi:hypothetical protein
VHFEHLTAVDGDSSFLQAKHRLGSQSLHFATGFVPPVSSGSAIPRVKVSEAEF